ncbi:MAG: hypothetical protein GJ676_20525 [Rhodobacteraceae bacterium]|nr:hypothetical protein [Paracoccaceae bacterium]
MADVSSTRPLVAQSLRRRRGIRPAPMFMSVLSRVAPNLVARMLARAFVTPRRHKAPVRELNWLKDAGATPLRLSGGQIVPLYEWLPLSARLVGRHPPTVLLVHGMSGRAGQMGGSAMALTRVGFRVVGFDAPAHGAAPGNRLSLPELVEVVADVGTHLGPLAAVVAHSNGAAATVAALAGGMKAEKVALIAPPENLSAYLNRLARHLGVSDKVAGKAQGILEERYGVRFEALRSGKLALGLGQPALIVHDCADRMVPISDGERLADSWTGAQMVRTNGLGHNRILRDETVQKRIQEFLSGGPGR